ncbi:hypothetical protein DOTSEDRAFT_75657 [Dothistroma septosporum NZE10]|uniref:Uncharacterized protein n=1 Tax=Dothistroma septosporum (strain NZE10 / CBS 128990) TaxID=675120 RepID=M2YJD5_DOTSN|nr:hypothetical protein DOTSEDRAFT_75657 [Dothistroma septosporum NZE10]
MECTAEHCWEGMIIPDSRLRFLAKTRCTIILVQVRPSRIQPSQLALTILHGRRLPHSAMGSRLGRQRAHDS